MFRIMLAVAVMAATPMSAFDLQQPAPARLSVLSEMLQPAQGFDCSDRSCKALTSCEEACHKLLVCGQQKRDGDNDGIPCETLCRRRC